MPQEMDVNRNQVEFRANRTTLLELRRRQRDPSLGLGASRDLARYYSLLEAELATLDFTGAEAELLMELLQDTYMDPHTIPLLWAIVTNVADTLQDRERREQAHALVKKLCALTPGQAYAIADAVERYWLQPEGSDPLQALGRKAQAQESDCR